MKWVLWLGLIGCSTDAEIAQKYLKSNGDLDAQCLTLSQNGEVRCISRTGLLYCIVGHNGVKCMPINEQPVT